ncbi:MAG: hypothetical protein H6923_00295 [Alphaproteobacteria bacterium]|nr:hypothetical protein [Alphaproteobacteria bacterium]
MRNVIVRLLEGFSCIALVLVIVGATARGFLDHGMGGAILGFAMGALVGVIATGFLLVLVGIYDHTSRVADALERRPPAA